MSGCEKLLFSYYLLSNQAHRSFCDEVCNPPRYLYSKIGLVSSSSRLYREALVEVLLCVESVNPVAFLVAPVSICVAMMVCVTCLLAASRHEVRE